MNTAMPSKPHITDKNGIPWLWCVMSLLLITAAVTAVVIDWGPQEELDMNLAIFEASTMPESDAVLLADQPGMMFDLGYVKPGDDHSISVALINRADTPLKIQKIRSECKCMMIEEVPDDIPPHTTMILNVIFSAPQKPVQYDSRIIIVTDDPKLPMRYIQLRAAVGVPLWAEPEAITLSPDTSKNAQVVTLRLLNKQNTSIRPLYATCTIPEVVVPIPAATIAANGEMMITVQLPALYKQKQKKNSITIYTADTHQPRLVIPIRIVTPQDVMASSTVSDTADRRLKVVYFYSPSCNTCEKDRQILTDITTPHCERLIVQSYPINELSSFKKMLLFEHHYQSSEQHVPKVFVGKQYLAGSENIHKKLGEVLKKELAASNKTYEPPIAASNRNEALDISDIANRFDSFSISAIAIAGFVDGINPCAFTTIVFLVSMLGYLKRSRSDIAVVGTGFTIAVFLTYFLLGIGLLNAIKLFSVQHGIAIVITYFVATLTFILAAWSLVDCLRYARTGSSRSITLGLPKSVTDQVHRIIRRGLTTRRLLIGAFTVGCLVALLESLCTGQVYLPTIMLVVRSPELRALAVGYLLLYNLVFISPLVIVLLFAYFGIKSKTLGNFYRHRLSFFKYLMAVLFTSLGLLIINTL